MILPIIRNIIAEYNAIIGNIAQLCDITLQSERTDIPIELILKELKKGQLRLDKAYTKGIRELRKDNG